MIYSAPGNSFFSFMSNGALAIHDGNWEGTNGEWNGEIPDVTEIREIENPVDHHRIVWRGKIDAALQSLKKDEERERKNILGRHPHREMDMECED